MLPNINNFLTTGCYILFVKILAKCSKKVFLVFIRFAVCFAHDICYTKASSFSMCLQSNILSQLNTIDCYSSNLSLSINQCYCKPYTIHQPLGWACKNSRLLLKVQFIVGSSDLIFWANDTRTSVCVLFVETLET